MQQSLSSAAILFFIRDISETFCYGFIFEYTQRVLSLFTQKEGAHVARKNVYLGRIFYKTNNFYREFYLKFLGCKVATKFTKCLTMFLAKYPVIKKENNFFQKNFLMLMKKKYHKV